MYYAIPSEDIPMIVADALDEWRPVISLDEGIIKFFFFKYAQALGDLKRFKLVMMSQHDEFIQ